MALHPGNNKRRIPADKLDEVDPIRRALQENEDWYRDLVEHSQDLLCIHDLQGRLLSVNPAPARILGYSVEELLKIPMRETIAPEYRGFFDAYLIDIAKTGQAKGLMVVMTRSGERRTWEFQNTLRTEGVTIPIVRGLAHDVTERRRAELLLEEAAVLNRRIISSTTQGVAVFDRDLRCVTWNPFMENFSGVPASKALGNSPTELASLLSGALAKMFQSMLPQVTAALPDVELVDKGGNKRWVSGRKSPLRDEQGEIAGAMITLDDQTERRQAALQLEASEKRFHAIYGKSPVGIALTDTRTGRLLQVNPKYCEIVDRSEQDLLNRDFQSFTHPDDLAQDMENMSALAAEKTRHFEIQKRYLRPDGSVRWVSLLVVPMWSEGESPVWHMAMVQDITESRQASEALRTSEERFREMAENIEEIFWMLDAASKQVIYVSPAFEKICGRTCASLYGEPLSYREVIHPDDRMLVLTKLDDLVRTGEFDEEFRIIRPDGRVRWVWNKGFPIRDARGNIYRLAGVAQDVTEKRKAEDALRESESRERARAKELETVLDAVPVPVFVSRDASCIQITANRAGYEQLRLAPGSNFSKSAPIADQPAFRVMQDGRELAAEELPMQVAAVTGKPVAGVTLTVVFEDGVERETILNAAPLLDEYGKVRGVIGASIDLTERNRAEEALRRSEENYRHFVGQSSEGIFRQDLDAPIPVDLNEDELVQHILHDSYMAECNDAMAKMYGFVSAQDFLGKRLTEILVADDPLNIQLTRDFIRSGFRVIDRESHEVDIHGNAKVFLNSMIGIVEDGVLLRTWGIQRDITEKSRLEESRKQAEEALRRSEERFRLALQGSPIKVFNQDRDLRYTWVYNLQEGWTEDMYLGKTDEEIFNPEDAAQMTALKRYVLENGQKARGEITLTTQEQTYYCDLTVEPLRDATGAVVGVNCAYADVTHLREIMEELRQAKDRLSEEKLYLEQAFDTELGFGEIIGQSKALKAVMQQVAKVAASDATVLLLGETGTGKELFARAIHRMSKRKSNSFIKMNCAAIPSGLLESELFGHEKGAFTGAVARKVGRLELADRGTLFLDEIGEIALELQPKLLRVLQDQEFERLGSTQTLKVNFRLVAATNRDLRHSMELNEFRSDLFYRLNVFPIRVPPLRERREDIRALVEHFVHKCALRMNKSITSIPKATMDNLMQWDWPGNIRELENFVERSVILTHGSVLQVQVGELSKPA